MENRQIWVYDVETLASCFTYTAINVDTEEVVSYVLHKDRNDWFDFINHLKMCRGQIGFNNVNFDYPIIHYILKNSYIFPSKYNAEEIVSLIYTKAQEIIESQDKTEFYDTVAIKQKDVLIPQLDLYKIWHYNNKARKTSLKALEISMNYPNVMEMPISHKDKNITIDHIPSILEYNLNDVLATYEFYKRSAEKISLRKSLIQTYNIPCINFSDSKIGEQLILKLYCDKTETNPWEVKKLRTYRESINLGECILPIIKFESKEFSDLLEYFKSKVITNTKGAIEKSVIYKGFKYDYGTGGIHGCIKSGLYEADDEYMIIDADVASLYPNIAIKNGFYIEHLGKEFSEVYSNIIELRMKAKKEGNTTLSDGFKLSANSVYGKSNDENSFLYDPKFTMQITLNGQLLLTMLAEELVNYCGNFLQILQINTDGITVKIHKDFLDGYYDVCKGWEYDTNLTLEYVEYSKMWIGDVNNYGALTTTGKIKNKGRFEVDKVVGSEPAYHKDNSFRIVPLALQEYFVKGIPVEQTIMNHTDIYDFCGRQKFTRDSYGQIHHLGYKDGQPIEIIEKQQKNVRYYISNKGSTFIKHYNKGTSEMINKGYKVTIFNDYVEKPMSDYDINYNFYIKECNKEIDNIIDKQLNLF